MSAYDPKRTLPISPPAPRLSRIQPGWAATRPHDARHLPSDDVLQLLADLLADRGPPDHIRPDNAPELTANAVRKLFSRIDIQASFTERGSPWENAYSESSTPSSVTSCWSGRPFTPCWRRRRSPSWTKPFWGNIETWPKLAAGQSGGTAGYVDGERVS